MYSYVEYKSDICVFKTESLHIKTCTTVFLPPQITINNLSISYDNKVKTLGILIDPTLQFHIPTKSL